MIPPHKVPSTETTSTAQGRGPLGEAGGTIRMDVQDVPDCGTESDVQNSRRMKGLWLPSVPHTTSRRPLALKQSKARGQDDA